MCEFLYYSEDLDYNNKFKKVTILLCKLTVRCFQNKVCLLYCQYGKLNIMHFPSQGIGQLPALLASWGTQFIMSTL